MEKRTILLFTDDKKEEVNLVNYFRASDRTIKVAREMADLRHYVKNTVIELVLIDSSMERFLNETLKILETVKIKFICLIDDKKNKNILSQIPEDCQISKPYSFKTLVEMISAKSSVPVQYNPEEAAFYLEEAQYMKVKIEDVMKQQTSHFDVYVKINDKKYVKIIKIGQKISSDTLKNIANKGVNLVYANREDYSKYLDILTKSAVNIKTVASIPKEKKIKFLSQTSSLIQDQIIADGVSKELFYQSKQVLDSSIEVATQDDNVFNMLSLLHEIDEATYRHSLAMSIYSVLIAKQFSWENEVNYFKISLGALFADIGLKGIDPKILQKANSFLNKEEASEYCKHPLIGSEIMRACPDIFQDVLDIIEQHHENNDGTGYPRKLNRNNIHPMAKIVRVAHEFAEMALKTEHNPNPDPPQVILQRLLTSGTKKLESSNIFALAQAHNIKINQI